MKKVLWFLAVVLLSAPTEIRAGDLKSTAKVISEKYHQAIVTVRMVIRLKQNYMGQTRDQEQKLEVNGTIIDPSGLTVTSASSIDPASSYRLLAQANPQLKIESEIKETNLFPSICGRVCPQESQCEAK